MITQDGWWFTCFPFCLFNSLADPGKRRREHYIILQKMLYKYKVNLKMLKNHMT